MMMMYKKTKEVKNKLLRGVLDIIVLTQIKNEVQHGYKIIKSIRRKHGIRFGASTIYPLLHDMEKENYLKSEWDIHTERARKLYTITNKGKEYLNFNTNCFMILYNELGVKKCQEQI